MASPAVIRKLVAGGQHRGSLTPVRQHGKLRGTLLNMRPQQAAGNSQCAAIGGCLRRGRSKRCCVRGGLGCPAAVGPL